MSAILQPEPRRDAPERTRLPPQARTGRRDGERMERPWVMKGGAMQAGEAIRHDSELLPANDGFRLDSFAFDEGDGSPTSVRKPTAWLLDAPTPEFTKLFAARVTPFDALFRPWPPAGERGGWPDGLCVQRGATWLALRRALALRLGPQDEAARSRMLLAFDRRLAARWGRRLSPLQTHVVVSQNLLPHLWLAGALEGRSFEVLMTRLPLAALHSQLDEARRLLSPSEAKEAFPLPGAFHAPADVVHAEADALAAADQLHTAHCAIADLLPARTNLLAWEPPKGPVGRVAVEGRTLLFPASPLGHTGAYALREALEGLDVELAVISRAPGAFSSEVDAGSHEENALKRVLGAFPRFEEPRKCSKREPVREFFAGIHAREIRGTWPRTLAAVVLPAVVQHEPRALLAALAAGVPVIATRNCGLPEQPGLTLVPAFDATALRRAIVKVLYRR